MLFYFIVSIILFLILLISIRFIIYVLNDVFNSMKSHRKGKRYKIVKILIIILVISIPFVLFLIDFNNLISSWFPEVYSSISKTFDLFSFFGTYISTIISALLLIVINNEERIKNTENLRNSQRPYLDVSYLIVKAIEKNRIIKDDNSIALSYGTAVSKKKLRSEYMALFIKNNGASVAIIDVNKTKIKLQDKDKNVDDLNLNASIKRLSIKSGESIYIFIEIDKIYEKRKIASNSQILKSDVYYKDLFEVNYIDSCQLKGNKIDVLLDNQKIDT